MFGLAERLHMTVAALSASMGSGELTEWIAYDRWKANPAEEPTREELNAKIRRMLKR